MTIQPSTLALHKTDTECQIVRVSDRMHPAAPTVTLVDEHLDTLQWLGVGDIHGVIGERAGDVSVWGGGITWTITEAEADALREISRVNTERHDERQRRQDEAEDRHYAAMVAAGLCPHCHTFCDGDCRAN